jgi:(2Fe-2S) ferredoxin
MVVYTYYGQRAIWYGRVTPCHCKDILENTVDNDRVIDNLVRGVFEVKTQPKLCPKSLDW